MTDYATKKVKRTKTQAGPWELVCQATGAPTTRTPEREETQ